MLLEFLVEVRFMYRSISFGKCVYIFGSVDTDGVMYSWLTTTNYY